MMRNFRSGLALAAVLMLTGCLPAAAPTEPAVSEQPQLPPDEAAVDQSTEAEEGLPAEQSEAAVVPPEEVPAVRQMFRLPFTLEVEEDAVVFVQRIGATEVFRLAPRQTALTLQTIRQTEPSQSNAWLHEEPAGPAVNIVIASGEKAYATDFYYERNVLASATDGPGGIGYLHASDSGLAQLFREMFGSAE